MTKAKKDKLVLVTGVFDVIHIEHLRFLKKAKERGDKLIVGIESDKRVREIKGHERPVNDQRVRQEQLEALRWVDGVIILPEQFGCQKDWEDLLKVIKPDVYAVSSHTSYIANKQATCERLGIEFTIVHEFNPHYSTSTMLNKLMDQKE